MMGADRVTRRRRTKLEKMRKGARVARKAMAALSLCRPERKRRLKYEDGGCASLTSVIEELWSAAAKSSYFWPPRRHGKMIRPHPRDVGRPPVCSRSGADASRTAEAVLEAGMGRK